MVTHWFTGRHTPADMTFLQIIKVPSDMHRSPHTGVSSKCNPGVRNGEKKNRIERKGLHACPYIRKRMKRKQISWKEEGVNETGKRIKEHKRLGESSMWLCILTARVEKRACRSRRDVFAAVRQSHCFFFSRKMEKSGLFRQAVGLLDPCSVFWGRSWSVLFFSKRKGLPYVKH